MDPRVTADELAIQRVLARYCHTCDDGDFTALVALFSPDGVFTYGTTEATGSEALSAFFTGAQTPERRGKHLTVNTDVRVDGDSAEARSDFLFLAYEGGVLTPRITGRYDDRLVRVGEHWLIARRDATPLAPHRG